MNLSQFYENVIFRDLVEYLMPGFISSCGLWLILAALTFKLELIAGVLVFVSGNNLLVLAALLVIAYASGQCISGWSVFIFRRNEGIQVRDILRHDQWLGKQAGRAITADLKIKQSDIDALLDDAKTVNTLREIGRLIAQHRVPALYREWVLRCSILSRFCQNMAITMVWLTISLLLSAGILQKELVALQWPISYGVVLAGIVGLGLASVAIFVLRSINMRSQLTRSIFEIWCVPFNETSCEESSKG